MRVGLSDSHDRRFRWLSLVSIASILGWAVPGLLMLDKGFAVQDEGTYVLSYRFWSSNPYFVSGAHYFYGPVFEAAGESIPLLRLLRLVMVIGVNAWFARCFLTWLEQERPGLLPGSRTGLLLLLTASGGMSYLWTPLTPGYYDLTGDCCLVLASLLLLALAGSPRPAAWIPWATGIVGVVLVVTRWTAFPALVLMVAVALWRLGRASRGVAARYAAHVLTGMVVALLACQLFLVPLGRFATTLWEVSALTTVGNHSFGYLATHNAAGMATLVLAAAIIGLPLVLGLLAARAAARRDDDDTALRWLFGAAAVTTLVLPFLVGWHGGGEHGRAVVGVALAGLLVAALAAAFPPREPLPGGGSGRSLAVVLLLVPFLQAAGTNVPLFYVAAECLAMWVAFVLMVVTRIECALVTTTAVLVDLAVAVVATAMIAGTTTLMTPFKTTSVRDDTVRVPELGVQVAPTTARQYDALLTALRPYVVRGSTPMITLDEMAGVTYLLGGVPAGSTWTDAASPTRTAGILELACRNGDVSRTQAPILIVNRPIEPTMASAMDTCGFHYPERYRRLDVPAGPRDIRVFVPRIAS